jgi:hypothetical protein
MSALADRPSYCPRMYPRGGVPHRAAWGQEKGEPASAAGSPAIPLCLSMVLLMSASWLARKVIKLVSKENGGTRYACLAQSAVLTS